METYYKADAIITVKLVEVKPVTELTKAIKDKILALEVINEETVRHITATSRVQARVWIAQMASEGVIKTEAELIASKE